MGTRRYYLDKQRLPSVTGILGILEKRGLMHWAWKLGIEGKDYRQERGDAADIGTMTHQLFAAWCGGNMKAELLLPPGADCDKARELFGRVATYAIREGWEPVEIRNCDGKLCTSEVALCSAVYGYGGTFDALIRDREGRIWLADLKTSKTVYNEHWHQCAAYAQLVTENTDIKIHGLAVILAPREGAGISLYEISDAAQIDAAWQVFRNALAVYTWQKRLKKVAPSDMSNGATERVA